MIASMDNGVDGREQPRAAEAQRADRVIDFDVARSVAILGMIVVHFCLVAAGNRIEPGWMKAILSLLDGRASATFMILAGVGITLMPETEGRHNARHADETICRVL